MTFASDLKIWENAQLEFAKVLLGSDEKRIVSLEIAQWKFKDWDIKTNSIPNWEETYEIKFDTMAKDTGNFVIETRCSWIASGIYRSKADYIVYNVKWERRIQERGELILRLINTEKRITKWGDWYRAEMYVIKCTELPNLFTKIETNGPRKEIGQNDGEAK